MLRRTAFPGRHSAPLAHAHRAAHGRRAPRTHAFARLATPLALAALLALTPALAGRANALTTTDYISNCETTIRSGPGTSTTALDVIAANVVVSVDATVSGEAWSANCAGDVGGTTWLRITGIGGKSADSLYGSVNVYAAEGLFRKAAYIEGIDVSHWQGSIGWTEVARAGKRFVVAKVTEGIGWLDDRWSSYRTNAAKAGLAVTGYHFARPDLNPTRPRDEAAWFVSQLGLQPGMLVPALDLERGGTLTPSALTTWVGEWLDEVYMRTGVRAMIYTSPSFWKNKLADTRTFADQGYSVLWVAHWFVGAPSVPAANWGGRGWTFWQYSNCGDVSGISGCVDLDRYNGTDLTPVTFGADFSLSMAASIAATSDAPATASVKQGDSTTFEVVIDRQFFTLPIELTVSGLPRGATAELAPSLAEGGAATLTVTTSRSGTVTPTGTYQVQLQGQGNGLTRSTTATLVVKDGISPVATAPVSRLYKVTTLGSATSPVKSTWTATDAKGVTSYTLQRQANGGAWSTVGLASPTATSLTQGLSFGTAYRYRMRAGDAAGNLSGWVYGPTFSVRRTEQTSASVRYSGSWKTAKASWASGGSVRYTGQKGASVSYTFTGSAISWVSVRSPRRGKADVYVDGVLKATVDLHTSTFQSRRVVFAMNWAESGKHTITIVNRGSSGHPRVDLDLFVRITPS